MCYNVSTITQLFLQLKKEGERKMIEERKVRLNELKMGEKFYLTKDGRKRLFLFLVKFPKVGKVRTLDISGSRWEGTISLDTRVIPVGEEFLETNKDPIPLSELPAGTEFRFLEKFCDYPLEDTFVALVKYSRTKTMVRHCRSGVQMYVSSECLVVQGTEEMAKRWQEVHSYQKDLRESASHIKRKNNV